MLNDPLALALFVLKWTALVFLAGLIGQFGKSLTLRILAGRRGQRGDSLEGETSKEQLKRKKKEMKAEQKRRKKEAAKD